MIWRAEELGTTGGQHKGQRSNNIKSEVLGKCVHMCGRQGGSSEEKGLLERKWLRGTEG